jgi:hypothetical protein
MRKKVKRYQKSINKQVRERERERERGKNNRNELTEEQHDRPAWRGVEKERKVSGTVN